MIRARIEPRLKKQAEAALDDLGLSPTTAIGIFYRQIVEHGGLPFDVRIPTAATRRAMLDARTGRGVERAESVDELFAKLESDDEKPPRAKKKRPSLR